MIQSTALAVLVRARRQHQDWFDENEVAIGKTGSAIYEAHRITAAKAKLEAHKSQLRPPLNANAQPSPTSLRCQRTFRQPIGLIEHLRTNCSTQTTPTDVPRPPLPRHPPPTINTDRTPEPQPSSSSIALTFNATAPAPTAAGLNSNTPSSINLTTANTRDVDSVHTCPHCERTFASHIGLVGHFRIHLQRLTN
ncbi:hypothetical protein SprV_0200900200 [Sparganum proliferum]